MSDRPAGRALFAVSVVAAALGVGWATAGRIEAGVAERIGRQTRAAGLDWLDVSVDGLVATLAGAAPDAAAAEAARAEARAAARFATVVDGISAPAPVRPAPPEPVTLEILVAADGVTLSGLAPDAAALDRLSERLGAPAGPLARAAEVEAGPGWAALEAVAVEAATLLAHGRVAVALDAGAVAVTGLPRDNAARDAFGRLATAARAAGASLTLALETLRAPVPAATDAAPHHAATLDAPDAGPTASPEAVGQGGATDAPAPGPAAGGTKIARLAGDPAPTSAAPVGPGPDAAVARLRAELSTDYVMIGGVAPDEATRAAVVSYAVAALGADRVHDALAVADAPGPEGWRAAALAAIDALSKLDRGVADVAGGRVRLTGAALRPLAAREAQAALSPEATGGWPASARVTVDLPALAALSRLTPAACAEELTALAAADPIRFAPSSAEIDASSAPALDALAAALARCDGGRIEVGGHTDAQGSEGYNQRLSQARAEAVRAALVARGARAAGLTAKGYGEDAPVADNATEVGRALNRRIAFTALAKDATP